MHLPATLLAAAVRRSRQPELHDPAPVTAADLRKRLRVQRRHRLFVFCVDASDSMGDGSTARMIAAKGAVLALLQEAYLNRDRVAMISFNDREAQTLLPPTSSIDLARKRLYRMPVGGATPLADGLDKSWQLIRQVRVTDPLAEPLLVLLSDGEANVPMTPGGDADEEALQISRRLAVEQVRALVIMTRSDRRNSLMERIADVFGTDCQRIANLKSAGILRLIDDK